MTAPRSTSRDLALVVVFAALIAALGTVPKLTPFGLEVPITAQTLGVMLAGCLLGARRGALAVLLFLALVAAGLPLLSGYRGGLGVLFGPSAGYLAAWAPGAALIGWFVERRPTRGAAAWIFVANVLGGMALIYAVGIPMQWQITHSAALPVVAAKSLLFVPGDIIKATVATAITVGVLRGYPQAMPTRRRASTEAPSTTSVGV